MKIDKKIRRIVNKKIKKLSKVKIVTNGNETIEISKLILSNARKVAELLMQASNSFGVVLKLERDIFIYPTLEGFLAVEVVINETNSFYVYVTDKGIDVRTLIENLMSHKLSNLEFDLNYILESFNEFRVKEPNSLNKDSMFIHDDMTGDRSKLENLSPRDLSIFCDDLIEEIKKLVDVIVTPREDSTVISLDTRMGTSLSLLVKTNLTSLTIITEDVVLTRISPNDKVSILKDVEEALQVVEY